MTREVAIKILTMLRCQDTRVAADAYEQALKMAIQALKQNESAEKWYKLFVEKLDEQEPCDKCEVGNPCLYCKHEFEPQESDEISERNMKMWEGIFKAERSDKE